jgi:hypothetical protein
MYVLKVMTTYIHFGLERYEAKNLIIYVSNLSKVIMYNFNV